MIRIKAIQPLTLEAGIGFEAKVLNIILLVVVVLSTEGRGAGADDALDRYDVVWDRAGASCAASMPIGNGDIGLNVWVELSSVNYNFS